MFESIVEDTGVAVRVLARAPGFSFIVVLTLAVGIGVNAAIFSVVDAVLLRPLPYPDADRVVTLGLDRPELGRGVVGFADAGYRHFVEKNRSFSDFGAYQFAPVPMPLTGDGEPLQLSVSLMTNSVFAALGLPPLIGRLPSDDEDVSGGPLVAVLSYRLWRSRFGSDPDVVGRVVELDARSREVIGVMPPEFSFPSDDVDLWVPLQLDPSSQNVGMIRYLAVARLRDDASIESASADADQLMKRLGEVGYGPAWFESTFVGQAYADTLKEYIVGDTRRTLLVVLGAVTFVLLIACANVANLFLVRAEARLNQTAMRSAIGATRGRLIRYHLTETMVLACAGGLGGLLVAYLGIQALQAVGPSSLPRLAEVNIHRSTFAYTAGLSMLSGLLFAIPLAVQTGQSRLRAALAGGRGATAERARVHARGVLIVAEVALALVLLIGSGLMVRTFHELNSVDPGFEPDGVVTFTLTLPPARYPDNESEVQFFEQFLERARALPGVEAAGAITTLPLRPMPAYTVGIDDFPTEPGSFPPTVGHAWITPGYLEAMRIPVRSGRGLEPEDEIGGPRTIFVSQAVQDEYWPDGSALSKRITTFGAWGEVAGVVGDVHVYRLDRPPDPVMYLPLNWRRTPTWRPMSVVVRTTADPDELILALREEVAFVDPGLPLSDIATMEDVVLESMSQTTFTMFLLVVAAFVSMFLGTVGVYGVISYVVNQRTAEFGVRAALGATSFDITSDVLRCGMAVAGLGVAVGLGAASLLAGLLESFLFEVAALDPLTFALGAALFLIVAAAACVVPARRAARVDPATALRK